MFDHHVLKKWNSCDELLILPDVPVSTIKKIHIYDFDNTLYKSPHLNRSLHSKELVSLLLNNQKLPSGNWWSDQRSLEEMFIESRQYKSNSLVKRTYWNKNILPLAELSCNDSDTISIILTGRKEKQFMSLITKIVSSDIPTLKFNAVCLKKTELEYSTTAEYKIALITDLMKYYSESLEEVTIYDDRISQLKKFREFFENLSETNKLKLKESFKWFVIPVPPVVRYLKPQVEANIVSKVINEYNLNNSLPLELKWGPIQTGFFLNIASQRRLIAFTISFFQKKPKMWVDNIPDYPAYIPCIQRGMHLSKDTIINIITNKDKDILNNPDKMNEIYEKFITQDYDSPNERCCVDFKLVAIGYNRIRKDNSKTSIDKLPKIHVFYKLKACSPNRYTYTEFDFLTIVGNIENKTPSLREEELLDTIMFDNSRIVWKNVPPVKLVTYFAQHSTLQLV
ncbi:hypothetical protein Kpol_541p5 [Vanderwaltozyma polyspora DSM 70294]|uniref:Uncharacterized protein n=1 Tax=Vanderwaltozyma polyspora (strain ATCC 22028 / DSM 70294 / BCRC 21397 / CBS 2163 / NBRC 10782 / NRRL Y-8283 / UCD 57-17) TaxID=436907 RepID=A7TIV0_VANPO|nr:uncharacterized protein Kpol_541p5 [Vanderwaltozyma polyspora DSM 70294]EDO17762.1 hypothetical protein Kpol_541p5 [Vanderwaltozyma polyspora DSM 70294]